jgi:hypothetical protein
MAQLGLIIGWVLTIFLGLLGLVILWLIISGRIDLKYLLSEPNGGASLSRFQFLVFTFVVALSLMYLTLNKLVYPDIPGGILALLGISGGSYVVSKGVQASRDVGMAEAGNRVPGDNPVNSEINPNDARLPARPGRREPVK